LIKAKKELAEYNRLKQYESKNPETRKFPSKDFSYAIVYELRGFPNEQEVNSVFYQRTGKSTKLSKFELEEFITIVNDKANYGGKASACHKPKVGLVLYNEVDQPIDYATVCFTCNNIGFSSIPQFLAERTANSLGFSPLGREKIEKLFYEWGYLDEKN
jgi:hypothetical protein